MPLVYDKDLPKTKGILYDKEIAASESPRGPSMALDPGLSPVAQYREQQARDERFAALRPEMPPAVNADALGHFEGETPYRSLPSALAGAAVTPVLPIRRFAPESATLERFGLPSGVAKPVAGAIKGAAGLAEGLTMPVGLALPGASSGAQKLASALFGVDMARHAPEAYARAGQAFGEGDSERGMEAIIEALGTTVFAGKAVEPTLGGRAQRFNQGFELFGDRVGKVDLHIADTVARNAFEPSKGTYEERKVTPFDTENLFPTRGVSAGSKSKVSTETLGGPERPRLVGDAPYLLRSKEALGFEPTKAVDARQVFNRLKNKVSPGEFAALEEAGLGEFLKEGKKSPEEVAKWVEENGPRVEVRELGEGTKDAPEIEAARKGRDELQHELETLGWRTDYRGKLMRRGSNLIYDRNDPNVPKEVWAAVDKLNEANEFLRSAGKLKEVEGYTVRGIAVPKGVDQMPGAVDLLVRVPVKSVTNIDAALIEQRGYRETLTERNKRESVKYSSDHYPTEGKNLLAHVRGYMETTPDGKKVFHVFEVQSDWAQHNRDFVDTYPDAHVWQNPKDGMWEVHSDARHREVSMMEDGFNTREQAQQALDRNYNRIQYKDPLLKHYERLAIKAAIDHARKNGADAIALSDAETAMLTEKHDSIDNLDYQEVGTFDASTFEARQESAKWMQENERFRKNESIMDDAGNIIKVKRLEKRPSQEKGMRLHYDQTLPKIAEELTGEKGQMVDFGEHQNAFDKTTESSRQMMEEGEFREGKKPRPDLIFRNPDGTPKTSITARLYPITNARKAFTLFGSDKAQKPIPAAKPSGPVLSEPKTTFRTGTGIRIEPKLGEGGFIRLPQKKAPLPPNKPVDVIDILPDFESKDVTTANAKNMAAIMGGKSRIKTRPDEAIASFNLEAEGIGPAITSAFGEKIKGQVNSYFQQAPVGEEVVPGRKYEEGDLNVVPNKPGLSLKASDVFETLQRDEDAYTLSPEQKQSWENLIKPVLDRARTLRKKYKTNELLDEYFPRGTTKAKQAQNAASQKRPIKKGTGTRVYETEAKGWEQGEKYSMDLEKRLVQHVKQMYSAIAGKRLARDKALGGRSRRMLEADLIAQYPDNSPEQIKRMAAEIWKKGRVDVSNFHGKEFSRGAVAEKLRKELVQNRDPILQRLAAGNDIVKGVRLGYDLGVPLVQGSVIAFAHPKTWAKATGKSLQALLDRNTTSKYVKANWDTIKEMRNLGSPVGKLEEYMTGAGRIADFFRKGKIESAAQFTEAFNRSFQTFLDVAKVELFKSYSKVTPKGEWPKMMTAIEASLLSGRMESGNVSRQRAFYERLLLNAPSYYRGAVTLVGMIGKRGVQGKIARRSLGSFLVGSAALYYGAGLAIGMKEEKLRERLDPSRADFMLWTLEGEKGERPLEVGIGNVYRSVLRLAGGVYGKLSQGKGGDLYAPSTRDNPLTRWYRAHSSPMVGIGWDLAAAKDFLGNDSSILKVLGSAKPLASESTSLKEAAFKVAGAQTLPARSPSAEDIANEMFPGKEIGQLSIAQRRKVQMETKARKYPESREETQRQAERALEYSQERGEDVLKGLSKESQRFVEDQQIKVPGYSTTQTFGGVNVPMTKEEREVFRKAVIREYEVAVQFLRGKNLKAFSQLQREKLIASRFDRARDIAMKEIHQMRKQNR